MPEETTTPLDKHAIELITALATEGAAPDVTRIDTTGLDKGLPKTVPLAFDRKAQAFKSVRPLLEEHRLAPARRKGTASADTLASFVDLINRHKDDNSAIFGRTSWPNPALTAVLNYDA